MDVMPGLTAITQAISITKFIREADRELQGAELKAKMAEIYEKLGDAKMSLVDAREAMQNLEQEISRLKEAAKTRAENTVVKNGLIYPREENGSSVATYPFCPRSNEVEQRLIRIMAKSNRYEAMCPNCKTDYSGDAVWYEKPAELVRQESMIRSHNSSTSEWGAYPRDHALR